MSTYSDINRLTCELKLTYNFSMLNIDKEHYIDTIIYSIDNIMREVKNELRNKIDSLNIGITSEQFVLLDTISCFEDLYQQKLSEIIMKDKSNTNRILKVLEQKGLIKKEFGKVNNRLVYFLKITPQGQEIVDKTIPKMKQFITDIFTNINNNEIEILHNLSDKFQSDLVKNSGLTNLDKI